MAERDEIEQLKTDLAELRREVDATMERLAVRELVTERVIVQEPDGTPRLILASRGAFPESVQIAGRQVHHPRPYAGLLFFNDDGDECGGLVFAGERTTAEQGGSLTFDQRDGDQVVQVWQHDGPDGREAGVRVLDQPDVPLPDIIDGAPASAPAVRAFVGKTPDGDATVTLHDANGAPRIRLVVPATGVAAIEVVAEDGSVSWSSAR